MAVQENVKVVVIGDGTVGKTCLLTAFTTNDLFCEEHNPTVFDNFTHSMLYEGKTVRLCLWDTSGQEEYERMRSMSYHGANVFLICFAVDNVVAFENVKTKWVSELKKSFGANLPPLVIVGTKCDRRKDAGISCVPHSEVRSTVEAIGGIAYVECSSKEHTNVKEVFMTATKHGLAARTKQIKDAAGRGASGDKQAKDEGTTQPTAMRPTGKENKCCVVS